ncbi:glycosyltransferase family 4 protein [bacterium]|nr:glycosyltransferase family 4 protein [bacterium]
MKVLYIGTAFARYEGDHVTPWLTSTVALLKKAGVDVEVFTSSYKGQKAHYVYNIKVHRFRYFFKFMEIFTHDKCVPEKLKESKFWWLVIPFYMFFGTLSAVYLVLKNRYQVVHVHWPFPHFIFAIIPRIFRKFKIVSTFHGTGPIWIEYHMPVLKPFLRFVLRYSDVVTVNSTFTRDKVVGKYGDSTTIKIVPFGTPVEEKKVDHPVEPFKVLFVGRLVKRKGPDYLIEAINLLKKEYPQIKLSVVGDGPERAYLEKMVKDLNLRSNVKFWGNLSPSELEYHYKSAHIFACPSTINEIGNTETLGVVIIEALTYKKPVVASRVGGIVDIIKDNQTGLLVEQKDSAQLAAAIKRLLDDPELASKLGENGYQHVQHNFSWNRIINDLISIYQDLTVNPPV